MTCELPAYSPANYLRTLCAHSPYNPQPEAGWQPAPWLAPRAVPAPYTAAAAMEFFVIECARRGALRLSRLACAYSARI